MKPIDKALRNKRILEWYQALPLIGGPGVVTRSSIVVAYAKHIGCPVSEIVFDMTGEDDLDFIYEKYIKLINKA
jgi:hypothetical protein